MRRVLTDIVLEKIAVVDSPCQGPALMTIVKGGNPINTKAKPDPEDVLTVKPSGNRGSTRLRHLRKDPSMNAIDKALAKMNDGELITQGDIHKIFLEKAADIQAADPKISPAQAYAKAYDDPANAQLRKLYMAAPNAAVPPAVTKRAEPTDLGWRCLQAKAAELRKADPKLTIEQAFAKAYSDPANRDFVNIHKQAAV